MLLSPFGHGLCARVFTAAELRAVKVHGRDPLLSSLRDRSGLMWSPGFIVITIRDNVNSLPTAGRWRRSALVLLRGPRCKGSAHVFGFPPPYALDLWPKNFYLIRRNKKKWLFANRTHPESQQLRESFCHWTTATWKVGPEDKTNTERGNNDFEIWAWDVICI